MDNNLIAEADETTEITNPILGGLGRKTGVSFFQDFIPSLIGLALVVGVLIFFAMLIMGAIQWISSGGDKEGLSSARGKITNAIIGIIILFSVFAIINLIEIFFNIKILTLDIGPLVIQ